jgi:hypothetical protein
MKKMILAISMEAPANPPKPKMPATNAMIKNVTTQLNMFKTSVSTFCSTSARGRFSRLGCGNKPRLEQMFLPVPAAETVKITVIYRNKTHG